MPLYINFNFFIPIRCSNGSNLVYGEQAALIGNFAYSKETSEHFCLIWLDRIAGRRGLGYLDDGQESLLFCQSNNKIFQKYLMNLSSVVRFLGCLLLSCSRVINWVQLNAMVAAGDYTSLKRSPQTQTLYLKLKSELKSRNLTMPDYVKDKIFGFHQQPRDPMHWLTITEIEGKMFQVYVTGIEKIWRQFIKTTISSKPTAGIKQGTDFILFSVNHFPYNLEQINHWVIWSSSALSQQSIQYLLKELSNEDLDVLNYENPPGLKSIPEINHYQLFWKKRDDGLNDL